MKLFQKFSHPNINPLTKFSLALAGSIILASCGSDSEEQTPSKDIKNSLDTVEKFIAPANGQLNDRQILLYVAVKTTEQELLDNAPDGQSFSGRLRYQDIEQLAAIKHGLSPHEYGWIKNTVINARIKAQFQEYFTLNSRIIRLLEDTLLRYEATKSKLQDAEEIGFRS